MNKIIFFTKFFIYFLFLGILLNSPNYSFCSEIKSLHNYQELPSLSCMLEKAMPSVVSIDVEGSKLFYKENNNDNTFLYSYENDKNNKNNKKLERRYFNALGSGVIIDSKKGYVVTNNHVISDANDIQVKLNDGRYFNAKIVGADINSDIAVIKLENPKNLTEIKFFDSDKVKIGDYAIAIGNPYGLGNTATYGIVSAICRNGLNIENYENFIQTDAAINKGSSGGALVNLNGELIGLNTAILSPKEGNIGIGFSIPSNMIKDLIDQIIKYGKVQKKELGIIGIEVNDSISKLMQLKVNNGIFISEIISDSIAEQFDIRPGDIIISMNNKKINNFLSFKAEIYSFPLNKEIKLKIMRNENIKDFFIKINDISISKLNYLNMYNKIPGLGISMISKNGKNIIKVKYVKFKSQAYKIGFRKDDIIININNNKVKDFKELDNLISKKDSMFIFYIKRGERNIYLFMNS
ncbi:Do family serine endopeptidase [Buchnera aphidicola (Ceratoglyphina bambusae)]|uniref:Do family serine endopeptidase n=1 Tax=Buchnera aphidicola TaxID=9 RepID=UPI0031B89890